MPDFCKSCGEEIMWRRTSKGVPHPINVAETPDGNILIDGDTCRILGRGDMDAIAVGTPRFTSHFATCPKANVHRKKKPQTPQEKAEMVHQGTKHPMVPMPTTKIPDDMVDSFSSQPIEKPEALTPISEPAKTKKRMLSDELAAMSKIDRILSSLPEQTRLRVLRWLGDPSRFNQG